MFYDVVLLSPVATPYGIAIERWEFPRQTVRESVDTIATATQLGWDYILTVSMVKDNPLPLACECDSCNTAYDNLIREIESQDV